MKIREYADADFEAVARIFYDTIHAVNAKDYSREQLFAWANNVDSLKRRREDLLSQFTLIAETEGETVGFGSMDKSGCLDLLYVHKDFQRQGIATALCDELEKGFTVIKTYASVTAKPFFEKRGYKTIKEQEVERLGIKLKNFEMRLSAKNS
ncbi:MAG: GNAT family N-acetyltransferase [Clostridia bacterium]|nr:GNAT family N-acetyltransferase [Clostridia bacterium]